MIPETDYVVYGDTDSIVGDSIILTKNGPISIEDLYDKCKGKYLINDDYNRNYIKEMNNEYAFTCINGRCFYDKIKYIMKHRIYKKMYKVICGKKEVVITEDHSLVVDRNGIELSIKPCDLEKGDKIIELI
jgi:intein/homing endonuclease